MVSHVQRLLAVLLAAGVIVYPLFSFAPKLYRWFLQDRMRKLYRRLRIVEEDYERKSNCVPIGGAAIRFGGHRSGICQFFQCDTRKRILA